MKKKLGMLLILLALPVAFAGCVTAPVVPPVGMVFTDYGAPLDVDADNEAVGPKMGQAESICILGLVATGDCSVKAAASAGGLRTVNHVDYHFYNVLGVFQRFTTIAYGE